MGLKKYKIGDFIEPFSKRSGIPNLLPEQVSGISIDKEFFEPAKQVGEDTSSYKVVPPNHFACNLMHVGRDNSLPIAMNHSDNNKYVSPAYSVFRIKDEEIVLKEYFFILLKSSEKDRYFAFHTDSSIRQGLPWEDFCDINITLPSIDQQRKYVDVYLALQNNLAAYQSKVEELKLVCDGYLDKLKVESKKLKVGDLMDTVDKRNSELAYTGVQGININKVFFPTVANIDEGSTRNYKVVEQNQLAFSGMQTGRDMCIRIALNGESQPVIVSPAYTVLKIKDENVVLAHYIMLWFSRKQIDRYGWFASDASIRSNLDLERFFDMDIPIPNISVQREIVNIHKCYIERQRIAEALKEQLKNICPVLIRGSLLETDN